MINISFSKEEAAVLINMINIAVKTVGLDAAEAGFILAKRVKSAVDAVSQVTTNEPSTPIEKD